MRVMVISTEDEAGPRYAAAKQQGYITFIYDHADPERTLARDKFMYISSDRELAEKLDLIKADFTLIDQVQRF